MAKIAVIGAGVIGLSSALNIIKHCKNVDVTIISEKFSPNTTGNISAAFWDPVALGDRETDPNLVRKWGDKTFKHMLDLATSTSAEQTGAQLISGYCAHTYDNQEEHVSPDSFISYRPMNAAELRLVPKSKFKEHGGNVIKRKVLSLDELEDYDIIVNCIGIAAKELLNDEHIYPVRGQVFKVKIPWLKHFVIRISEHGEHYIIPGANTCVVGGTMQVGNWNLSVDETDAKRIWEGCCELVPSLKYSKVLKQAVGLRPARTKVRLEAETVRGRNKTHRVIHNYGHGGAGVTLHWGCALDVLDIVRRELSCISTTSKL